MGPRQSSPTSWPTTVTPPKRDSTPLFGPSPGEEFTHSQLDMALWQLLSHGASVPASELHNYSVHSFRIYAACSLLAASTFFCGAIMSMTNCVCTVGSKTN